MYNIIHVFKLEVLFCEYSYNYQRLFIAASTNPCKNEVWNKVFHKGGGLEIFNEFRGGGGVDVRGGYLRKGGSNPPRNYGYIMFLIFPSQAQKFAIVVELLLGEIPDRATFRDPALKKTLIPYFQLTKGYDHLRYAAMLRRLHNGIR